MLQYEKGYELVQMQPYLQNLCGNLTHALSKEQFIHDCNSDVKLPLREAIYVGLVVNELITNVVKHKESDIDTLINILLQQNNKEYLLQIKEPNRQKGYNTKSKGLGLLIVKTLVEKQLGGSLEYDNKHHTTTIRFTL